MQKKILALAVTGALAAPAAALAQVEVYGTIHMSVNKMKYDEGTPSVAGVGTGSKSNWDITSHASNVGVRARESLGGGLSAWAQVETNAAMERSMDKAHVSGIASRNSALGMQGNFGNVFVGQWTTPWADLDALWGIGTVATFGPITSIIGRRETTGSAPNYNCVDSSATAGGAGAGGLGGGVCQSVEGAGGVGHPFWRRISNSLHYQSPVFGGAQVKVAYQVNQDKATAGTVTNADPSMWSASVTWSGMGGRLRVGGAFDSHKDFTTVGKSDDGFRVTGGWNFGFADVGFAWEQMNYKVTTGECEAQQYGVQVAVPVGQGAIRAGYSVAKDIKGDMATPYLGATDAGAASGAPTACGGSATIGAEAAGDNGAKQVNIGYDYRFSKRTTVGVGYAAIDNDPGARFTWSGLSSAQNGQEVTPPPGSDVSIFFISMIHRF